MNKNFLKKTAVFVIFMFGFFLMSEPFPTDSANQKRDKELLRQGEELYKNGEYEKALGVFREAEPYITDTNKRLILYFHMSLTYYALGNSNQAEESLRNVFGLDPGYSVIEENYPRGFIKIFNKIKAEIKAKIEAKKRAKEKEKKQKKVIEKPKPKKPGKKKKKFPVLLIVAGVAVVGLVVMLLSKKKAEPTQYTLTVTKGEGVDGSPNSGTMTYNQGAVVNYNYSLQSGYKDLEVRLDGNIVSSSGSITMDRNHTLTAAASPLNQYTLTVTKGEGVAGTPNSGATTYDEGTAVNYSYSLQSGYTNLVVTLDGANVSASGTITMNSNHTLVANATFAGDNRPSVTITSPSNGATVSGVTTITADASDDKGINKVEFYIDGSLKKTDSSSPYRYNWDTTNYSDGSHTIKVTAYDTANQNRSRTITVTVNNGGGGNQPSISITNPSHNATVSGTVTIRTNVSASGGVNRVEFYIDGDLKRTDTSSPYTYNWNTTTYPDGTHFIKAVVYDNSNRTDEAEILVTVRN